MQDNKTIQDKKKIIEKIRKKYIQYIKLIDSIGQGSMYLKDIYSIISLNSTKSRSQVYRDIQNLEEKYEAIEGFFRDSQKVITLKKLAYEVLEKPNPRQLRAGTGKLIRSSVYAALHKKGENFFLNYEENTEKLYQALLDDLPHYWQNKKDLFLGTKGSDSKNLENFRDFSNNSIFLDSFFYSEELKVLNFKIILFGDISQHQLLERLEDLLFFFHDFGEYDTKINVVVYTPHKSKDILTLGLLKAMRRYRKTRKWGVPKNENIFKNLKLDIESIEITHII